MKKFQAEGRAFLKMWAASEHNHDAGIKRRTQSWNRIQENQKGIQQGDWIEADAIRCLYSRNLKFYSVFATRYRKKCFTKAWEECSGACNSHMWWRRRSITTSPLPSAVFFKIENWISYDSVSKYIWFFFTSVMTIHYKWVVILCNITYTNISYQNKLQE